MSAFEKIVSALFVVALVLVLFIAAQEGRAKDDCRSGGGTPVKTDRGYACMKGGR